MGSNEPQHEITVQARRTLLFLLLILSVVFIAAGAWVTLRNYRFLQNSELIDATVSKIQTDRSTDEIAYRPVFSFTDKHGNPRSGSPYLLYTKFDFPIGSKIPILYDRRNPENIRVYSRFSLMSASGFLFFMGAILLILTLFLTLSRRKQNKQ